MPRYLFVLILVLTTSLQTRAQPTAIDPPIAGRPVDFSNIVGRYEIKATAAPRTIPVEGSILLTIDIIGEGPAKYEPTRNALKLIPASWENDFHIQGMPAEDRVMRDEKAWRFVYRLKPKHVDVKAIPLIRLHYYDPSQPEKNRFQIEYAGPISIKVTPRPEPPPIEIEDEALPDSFYGRASSEKVLQSMPVYELNATRLVAWLTLSPIACVVAVWLYRRSHPSRKVHVRRHQNGSAQRALASLPSAPPWHVVASYLRERLDFPALDGTPSEVMTFLKQRGIALSLCRQSRAFFEACDAARFTSSAAQEDWLVEEAKRLIVALEADPCVRG